MNKASPLFLLNAFSVNQLTVFPAEVRFEEVALDQARLLVRNGFISAVGHKQTAALFSHMLQAEVTCHRVDAALAPGSSALLGQYRGPRLAEGTTALPDDAQVRWYCITVG